MDSIINTLNHMGGVILVYEGIAMHTLIGLFVGTATGITIMDRRQGDIRAGRGLCLLAQSRLVEAIGIAIVTAIIAAAFFLMAKHFAQVNYSFP